MVTGRFSVINYKEISNLLNLFSWSSFLACPDFAYCWLGMFWFFITHFLASSLVVKVDVFVNVGVVAFGVLFWWLAGPAFRGFLGCYGLAYN